MDQKPFRLSRKLWIVISDAIFGMALLLVGYFVKDTELRVLLGSVFAIIQPVTIALINGIVSEDNSQRDLLQAREYRAVDCPPAPATPATDEDFLRAVQ